MITQIRSIGRRIVQFRPLQTFVLTCAVTALVLGLVALGEKVIFADRSYPNLTFAGIDLSYRSFSDIKQILDERVAVLNESGVVFRYKDQTWTASLAELGIKLDTEQYLMDISTYARTGDPFEDSTTILRQLLNRQDLYPTIAFTASETYRAFIETLAAQIELPEVNATLAANTGTITVTQDRDGNRMLRGLAAATIDQAFAHLTPPVVEITLEQVPARVTTADVTPLIPQAEKWITDTVHLKYKLLDWPIEPGLIQAWLSTAYNETTGTVHLTTNSQAGRTMIQGWSETDLNRPPKDAIFELTDAKVTKFEPSQNGIVLDAEVTLSNLDAALSSAADEAPIAVLVQEPEIKTAEVNDMGITERVARGVSYFRGSSNARMTNIRNAANKMNGVIIEPHTEFSYNGTIGDVSTQNGFVVGLVIEKGRTVEGVGGGVCQPSTTMFRAALDGGYPITERFAHAYRVHYYEEGGPGFEVGAPGIDATVYAPGKDLRFLNDTDNHILILTDYDRDNYRLTIDLYSTPTGRVSTISEPRVFNITAAPAAEYYDVPDQPVGYVKQIDWAAGGADTEFSRTILFPDGTTTSETFTSHYKAWSAKYERGTLGAEEPPVEPAPTI